MADNKTVSAGFGVRAAAYIIDRLLLLLPLGIVRLTAWLGSGGSFTAKAFLFDHSALDVLCYLLSAVYFVLLTYFTGSTLGKKVLRLRVESRDGEPLRFVDVLYRETVGRFLSGVLYLGYLMVLVDRQNRAFHDWLCDSRVVYDEGVVFRPRPGRSQGQEPDAADFTGEKVTSGYGYSIPGTRTEQPGTPWDPAETESAENPTAKPASLPALSEAADAPADEPDQTDEN